MSRTPPGTSKFVLVGYRPLGRFLGSKLFDSGSETTLVELCLLLARKLGGLAILMIEIWEEDSYERAFPALSESKVGDSVKWNVLIALCKS